MRERKEKTIKDLTKGDKMTEFIKKIEKLNNPELFKKLADLYLINPDEAWKEYRLALAKQIIKDKNALFKRLSDL